MSSPSLHKIIYPSQIILSCWFLACQPKEPPPSSADQCADVNLREGDLVITEIMAQPGGADGTEWIEIYNPSGRTLQLDELTLEIEGASETTFSLDGEIRPGDFIVLGAKSSSNPDFITFSSTENSLNLSDNGGNLQVRVCGQTIDEVSYMETQPGVSRSLDGETFPDGFINDLSEAWCDSTTKLQEHVVGTPGAWNDVCEKMQEVPGECLDGESMRKIVAPQPGDLVFTEYLADPKAAEDSKSEWFEVFVTRNVDLNGLEIAYKDGKAGQMLSALECMNASEGEYLVFARSSDPELNGKLPRVDVEFAFDLTNSGGDLWLWRDGTLLDHITRSSAPSGYSNALSRDFTDHELNDSAENWCRAQEEHVYGDGDHGTPGAENPSCTESPLPPLPPCWDNGIEREPIVPGPGDLLITEYLANPTGKDSEREWLEIYVHKDVDLNGLQIVTNSGTSAPLRETIDEQEQCLHHSAGEYVVIARSTNLAENGGLSPVDHLLSFTAANSSGSLGVKFGDQVVDTVSYEQTVEGVASAKDPSKLDTWCLASEAYGDGDFGSPGSANAACPTEDDPPMDPCLLDGEYVETIHPQTGDLRINEYMANPTGSDTTKEWVEVYVVKEVDLRGVQLISANSQSSPLGKDDEACWRYPAGSHVVFARSNDPAKNGGLVKVDASFNFSIVNSNGYLGLRLGEETLLDELAYENTSEGVANGRDPKVLASWCSALDIYGDGDLGTPGLENQSCFPQGVCLENGEYKPIAEPLPGDLVITEYMADPSGEDTGKEWVEVYVAKAIDLNGVQLVSGDSKSATLGEGNEQCLHYELGDYLVFAQSNDAKSNGGLPQVDFLFEFSLANSGDLGLVRKDNLIEQIIYNNVTEGASSSLDDPNAMDPLWCVGVEPYGDGDLGSPGVGNLKCG